LDVEFSEGKAKDLFIPLKRSLVRGPGIFGDVDVQGRSQEEKR